METISGLLFTEMFLCSEGDMFAVLYQGRINLTENGAWNSLFTHKGKQHITLTYKFWLSVKK